MKNLFLVFVALISFSIITQAQDADTRKIDEYISKYVDTSYYYRDAIINNIDNKSYPAVGNYRIEQSFYYDYAYSSYHILRIISQKTIRSMMEYSEYYVYDDFQNLIYYIYKCEECGGKVIKFNGNNAQVEYSSNDEKIGYNYFISPEDQFSTAGILERSKSKIKLCSQITEIPCYEEELKYVKKRYKEINQNKNLERQQLNNMTVYLDKDKPVKFIIKENDEVKEFYINNDNLMFVFYSNSKTNLQWRVYFENNSSATLFRAMKNRELITLTDFDDKYSDIIDDIQEKFMDFRDAFK